MLVSDEGKALFECAGVCSKHWRCWLTGGPFSDLFRSVLIATSVAGTVIVEMGPIPDHNGFADRGVVWTGRSGWSPSDERSGPGLGRRTGSRRAKEGA